MGNYASDQKTSRFFGLKLNRNTDQALIDRLDEQENIQAYLKNLIREDIEKSRLRRWMSDPKKTAQK